MLDLRIFPDGQMFPLGNKGVFGDVTELPLLLLVVLEHPPPLLLLLLLLLQKPLEPEYIKGDPVDMDLR